MSKIKELVVDKQGYRSLKRELFFYTWVWTITIATGIVIKYIVSPTEMFVTGLAGISAIVGLPITVMYIGLIVGEKQEKVNAPDVRTPSIK